MKKKNYYAIFVAFVFGLLCMLANKDQVFAVTTPQTMVIQEVLQLNTDDFSPRLKAIATTATSSNPAVISVERKYATDNNANFYTVTALSAGQATVNFKDDTNTVSFTFNVAPANELVLRGTYNSKDIISTISLKKGSSYTLSKDYSAHYYSEETGYVTYKYPGFSFSSNDTSSKVIKLDGNTITAVGPGEASVTVTVLESSWGPSPLVGKSKTINISVEEGAAISEAPKMISGLFEGAPCFTDSVYCYFTRVDGILEYEIYRATSKNGKYKKIATLSQNNMDVLTGKYLLPGGVLYDEKTNRYTYSAYKCSPNKQYFFKVRVRYIDGYSNESWGEFSNTMGYWTAAKPVKASYRKGSRKASWKKVSNAKYYIYTASGSKFLGYNIFGQKVISWGSKQYRTTKTKVTLPKKIMGRPTNGVNDTVIPITKHGKYYFYAGKNIHSNIKKFKLKSGAGKKAIS